MDSVSSSKAASSPARSRASSSAAAGPEDSVAGLGMETFAADIVRKPRLDAHGIRESRELRKFVVGRDHRGRPASQARCPEALRRRGLETLE